MNKNWMGGRQCSGELALHELDQELERRGHRFTRYADDCNIKSAVGELVNE